MIECVLFDLDGVLVDACDWHYKSLNKALMDMGHSAINEEEHITKYNGLPTIVKLKMLNINDIDAIKIGNLKQIYTKKIIQQYAKIMKEKQNMHVWMKSKNIKIACVTNSIRETAELMLSETGQVEFIDLLVSNEDVKNNKPSGEAYDYAIKKLGVDPNFSICVEDSLTGIKAAENSQVKFLWKVKNTTEVTLDNLKKFIENK